MNIETALAAIRKLESGDNYLATKPAAQGYNQVGAYGFRDDEWDIWTHKAGVPGANWRNPQAQDYVAGYVMNQYHARYGDWDMAAAAWYGGLGLIDRIASQGMHIDDSPYEDTRQYVDGFRNAANEVPYGAPGSMLIPQDQSSSNWIFPIAGPNNYKNDYHYQRSASQIADGKSAVHQGIDIFAEKGTPLVAPVGGTVLYASYGDKGGYNLKIRGDDGYDYYYAHMASQARVEKGQRIRAGYHVGFVGNSGNASNTSPHLHLEMKRAGTDERVNPYDFLNGGSASDGTYSTYHGGHADPSGSNAMMWIDPFIEGASGALAGPERQDYRTFTDDELAAERDTNLIELVET